MDNTPKSSSTQRYKYNMYIIIYILYIYTAYTSAGFYKLRHGSQWPQSREQYSSTNQAWTSHTLKAKTEKANEGRIAPQKGMQRQVLSPSFSDDFCPIIPIFELGFKNPLKIEPFQKTSILWINLGIPSEGTPDCIRVSI